MRDAFGGSFMVRIFIIFILVYILLTAVVLNYAKAYRAKELIISYLEDNEIYEINKMSAEEQDKMEAYFEKVLVGKIGYVSPIDPSECDTDGMEEVYCISPGIKIERFDAPKITNKKGIYYKVTTYYRYDIGFIRMFKAANNSPVEQEHDFGTWEISGETRPIVRD